MNLYDGSQNDYDLKENQMSSSINFKSKSTNSGTNLNNNLLPTPISITNKSFISSSTTATNKQNNNLLLNKSHQKSSGNIESTLNINNNNKPLTSSSSSKPQIRGYSVDRQITTGSEKKKK
jgi:hypothetical protein